MAGARAAAAFGAGLLFHFIWFRRPLRHMLGVAKAWVLGDASARLAVPLGLTELDDVAVAFNQAADAAEDRARVWTRFRALADNIPQLAWMATSGGASSGTTSVGRKRLAHPRRTSRVGALSPTPNIAAGC